MPTLKASNWLWGATLVRASRTRSTERDDPLGSPCIELAPIGGLRANRRNPRTHSKKQIGQIRASIRKLGFLNPIIVDDENMILAGHGRFEASRLEGLTRVP